MSKERARRREARLAQADAEKAARALQQQRRQQMVQRQQRRATLWRRVRLWQRGPQHSRERERWTALSVVFMLVAVVTWIVTESVKDILIAMLIGLVGLPLLIAVVVHRDQR